MKKSPADCVSTSQLPAEPQNASARVPHAALLQGLTPLQATSIHALCVKYDFFLDIDCATGTFEIVPLTGRVPALPRGEYSAAHTYVGETFVAPEHRDVFCIEFNLQSMKALFASGVRSSAQEYKWIEDGQTYWKHHFACPYELDDGTQHILIYVRDVSEEKHSERTVQQEDGNSLRALQSMYAEIFRIDADACTITPLYYNLEQVSVAPEASDLEVFFSDRAQRLVHPEHREHFLQAYNAKEIKARIRRSETFEVEYRKRQTEVSDYRWIAGIIRPMKDCRRALLFLRDITRIKETENRFFTALKKKYDAIFIVDLYNDSVRFVTSGGDVGVPVELSLCFSKDTRLLADTCVHPEDRDGFLSFFDNALLWKSLEEKQTASMEYRIRNLHGAYRWYETVTLPMPGASASGEILVLSQDVHSRKQLEGVKNCLEERYNAVFRQSCDITVEVNLRTGGYVRNVFTETVCDFPPRGDYTSLYENYLRETHPDDRARLRQTRSLDVLRKAYTEKNDLHCLFRMRSGVGYAWMDSRIVFITNEDDPLVFLLTRDVTASKLREDMRNQETQSLVLALRDTYTEIYELDMLQDSSRLLFSNSVVLSRLNSSEMTPNSEIIASMLHPADKERMAISMKGEGLLSRFSQGATEITEEFRRMGVDGQFHWVGAIVTPLKEEGRLTGKGLIFIKDISQRKEREEQQRIIEQYSLALRNIYDFFCECSMAKNSYRIVHHSSNKYAFLTLEGRLDRFLSLESRSFIHAEDWRRFVEFFTRQKVRDEFADGRKYRMAEFRTLHTNGEHHWTSYTMFPLVRNGSDDESYLIFGVDVHAFKTTENLVRQNTMLEQQRVSNERYRIIVEQTNTLIFEWKFKENQRYISPELTRRFQGDYGDGRDILDVWQDDDVVHPEELPAFRTFRHSLDNTVRQEVTVRLRQRSGGYLWCRIAVTNLYDDGDELRQRVGTLNDVDDATRSAQTLRRRAERDALTGALNMHTFYASAERLIRTHLDTRYAIILMDIDGFKVVNDLHGLDEGDRLLKAIATALQKEMTPKSVCGRISGDIFCACVDFNYDGVLRLIKSISEYFVAYPLPTKVSMSFGICWVENVNTPINLLCDWANMALRTVKGNAVNLYAFYDDTLRQSILREKKIANEMRDALAEGEFKLYLQPKIHIPSGRIVGAEGLVRWQHPAEGILGPDSFVPLFEKNGFIIRLDEYVWEQACMMLRRWLDLGYPFMPVSLNVSRLHMHETRLVEKINLMVRKYGLPASLIEFELTESVFLDCKTQSFAAIQQLRRMGFRFSLDDFGAGYSSLNILKSLPVDVLKIDRGFLDEIVATDKGRTIIRCIIALARSIDMDVVAEGVETQEQADFLNQAGCSLAQGFLYSRPVTVEAFEALVFTKK